MNPAVRVVFTDANVLINLAHAGFIEHLAQLRGYSFAVPENVLAEIIEPAQRAVVANGIETGALAVCRVEEPSQLALFAELRDTMGAGEASCLAVASGDATCLVASDEKRLFLRTAEKLLGPGRVLTTSALIVKMIENHRITIEAADAAKELLAKRKFRMAFASFHDIVSQRRDGNY